jgi:nitrite reductase (cytochrome c-552)
MTRTTLRLAIGTAATILATTLPGIPALAAPASEASFRETDCYECHTEVGELRNGSKHAALRCTVCHDGLGAHLADATVAPSTRTDLQVCGGCHSDQLDSFTTFDYKKLARVEKAIQYERAPDPLWDKLMAGHGFTKEHANPRGHTFALVDHLVVDRSYGGRFQPKNGWLYVTTPGALNAWDLVEDRYPDVKENKAFLPESAAAASPTCLQCKSQDQILSWKYLGDKDPDAKMDRTTSPLEAARMVRSSLNCIFCHDPHAARPRIVRDALIQALTRPEKDTVWHKDPKATGIRVVDFSGFRKIAMLEHSDTKLQCGQCHVEYTCNTGYDPRDGSRVTWDSPVTNHFPFKDVFGIYDHYNALNFRDFRHAFTGGFLWKAQHAETETFWSSKHAKLGAGCNDCHMPKVKNKAGRTFTSHWQTSPRNYLEATCMRCHKGMTAEQAVYQIDSIRSFTRGKMRKAEFWLATLIDRIVAAKQAGLDEAVIKQAQEQHQKAHVLWEWWTAENSDGFHNPEMARESLTTSVVESRKGIELVDKALEARAGTTPPPAHP